MGPSQRLDDLKHRSAATHLLGLGVRIPPERRCLSLVSGVFSGTGKSVELITHPEESYRMRCVQWV